MRFLARTDGILSWLAARGGWLPVPVLLLVSALLILPGFFSLPPIDRDETRFSQASRQMVESGDLIDIRLGEGTRYKKPIGIYWLQSASLTLVGAKAHIHDIWAYRLPSAVAALVSVVLTYRIALVLMGAPQAFVAALLLASCFVFGAEARLAKTDSALLASILACQMVLARLWIKRDLPQWMAYGFWGAMAASILIKGPIGPMVVLATLVPLMIYNRGLRWLAPLRPLPGTLLMVILVLPWYIAISVQSQGDFWVQSLGRDLLAKVGEGQESHGAPPGFYLAALWVTFWPAAILVPFAVAFVWQSWRSPAVVFLLAWILPSWVIFELTATKLVHYVLPTYPALAILCACGWMQRTKAGRPGWILSGFAAVLLLIAMLFPAAAFWANSEFAARMTLFLPLGMAFLLLGAALFWISLRAGLRLMPIFALMVLSLGMMTSLLAHLARVPAIWPSVAMARAAAELPCAATSVISTGFQEESLMLLNDAPVTFAHDPKRAAALLQAASCAIAFVDAPQVAAFETAASDMGLQINPIGMFDGFAIGGADEVRMTFYTKSR